MALIWTKVSGVFVCLVLVFILSRGSPLSAHSGNVMDILLEKHQVLSELSEKWTLGGQEAQMYVLQVF